MLNLKIKNYVLKTYKANELIKIAEKNGFYFVRQKGSHRQYRKDGVGNVTIPVHGNKELNPNTAKSILMKIFGD